MTINVMFVIRAVFVPHLWDIVEYLFSGAIAGFAVTGYYAIKIFLEYFTRLIDEGDSTFDSSNNLSQMISIFTFTMVAVCFAAPAAMSKTLAIEAISIVGATFFASMAILLILVKLTSGFQNMLKSGIGAEASPSLWIMIPILTLLGITFVRLMMGFEHNFKAETHATSFLVLTTVIVSLQLVFGKIGYFVMRRNRYFRTYVNGDKLSIPSFSLICPGVAFMVFWFFFVHFGFVHTHIVSKYSLVYFLMLLPGVLVQIKTIQVFLKLENKFKLLNLFTNNGKVANYNS